MIAGSSCYSNNGKEGNMHELKSVPRDVFCLRITMDLRKHPVNILLEKLADQVVNHPDGSGMTECLPPSGRSKDGLESWV